MNPEMRHKLAQLPFEEKIRKVGELIRLSRKVKTQRVREDASNYPQSSRSLPAAASNPAVQPMGRGNAREDSAARLSKILSSRAIAP